MKRLLIISLFVLSGCTALKPPVKLAWPEAPAELQQPADELTSLPEDSATLTDMIQNANDNYAKYYQLKDKYQGWQDWYKAQKAIQEKATQ